MFKKLSVRLSGIRLAAGILLAVFVLSTCGLQIDRVPAELIFRNAKIYTQDKNNPVATAIAIRDGQIIALGNDDDTDKWRGSKTRVIDLAGRPIMPSFGDAHVHPVFGGLAYSRCSMHGGNSIDDYKAVITKCVEETDSDRWVYGVGWAPGLFPPDGIPQKEILDTIAPDRPLVFRSTGGHSLWVNSKALELAGITKDTPDPANGRIDRDPVTGELLGGLQETAKDLVASFLPEPTQKDFQNAILYTIDHLNVLGISNFLDAGVDVAADGTSAIIDAYKVLQAAGDLNAHIEIAVKWNNEAGLEQIPALMTAANNVSGPNLSSHTLKIWIDGVIAQRTAALLEPYSDAPAEHGEPTMTADMLNEVVSRFDAEGFQVMIHAIGDKAIRMALDAFDAAREQNGINDNHHQITHAELITSEDIIRFSELDVVANFQPLWSTMDPYMQMTAVRIGPERMGYVYPANSVLKAGGKIVYGSDWSVASANPFEGIEVALTRRTPGQLDAVPLLTDEAVTLAQALEAYTLMVAYVNHNEDRTGSLAVGKSGDLIVLDQDIFTVPTYDISKTNVLLTLYAGEVVYGSLEGL